MVLVKLHRVSSLRLLSIRLAPSDDDIDVPYPLPMGIRLSELLAANPQLEVRLLLPAATIRRWWALGGLVREERSWFRQDWRELKRMVARTERITLVEVDQSE